MCRGYEHIEDLNVSAEEKEPETSEIEEAPDEDKPDVKIEELPEDTGAEDKEESEIKMES